MEIELFIRDEIHMRRSLIAGWLLLDENVYWVYFNSGYFFKLTLDSNEAFTCYNKDKGILLNIRIVIPIIGLLVMMDVKDTVILVLSGNTTITKDCVKMNLKLKLCSKERS